MSVPYVKPIFRTPISSLDSPVDATHSIQKYHDGNWVDLWVKIA